MTNQKTLTEQYNAFNALPISEQETINKEIDDAILNMTKEESARITKRFQDAMKWQRDNKEIDYKNKDLAITAIDEGLYYIMNLKTDYGSHVGGVSRETAVAAFRKLEVER